MQVVLVTRDCKLRHLNITTKVKEDIAELKMVTTLSDMKLTADAEK